MANVTWDSGNKSASITLGAGNAASTTTLGSVMATSGQASGKFYYEFTLGPVTTALSGSAWYELGFAPNYTPVANTSAGGVYLTGESATTVSIRVNTTITVSTWTPATWAAGTVVGVAVDVTNQRAWFRVAGGNWNNSGTADPTVPSTGLSIASLFTPGTSALPRAVISGANNGLTANFGDSAFSGTVPTGYTAGMPTGGTNNALFTQAGAEVWSSGSPGQAQFTQMGVEVWRSVLDSASPGKGQLIITGYPPSQINDVQTLPGVGGLIITGYAPTDAMQFKPGRGQLIVTGYPPLLVGDVQSAPGVGGLIITGKVPSHGESITLPGGATLTIVGYEPTLLEIRSGTMAQVFILT